MFIKGLSLKIIIHKVKGNINIVGFILKASLKLNETSAKKALPRPHPGQGIPVINKNGHENIYDKCVEVEFMIKSGAMEAKNSLNYLLAFILN